MFCRVIHVVPCVSALLLFLAESYSIVWTGHVLLICSSAPGHLGCFPRLAITQNVSVNTGLQIPVRVPVSSFLTVYLEVELLGHVVTLC